MNIVVTGGASGVGEALVERLSGHSVWILDVKPPAAASADVTYLETDMSDVDSIEQSISALPECLYGLANVAGIAQAKAPETVLAVNFLGLRHLCERLMPRLQDGGRIVNVSSVGGRGWQARKERLEALMETADFVQGYQWCKDNREFIIARDPYLYSKQMATAYTLRRSLDAMAQGVRMNCVSPGTIHTPLYAQFESLMGKAQSDWMIEQTGGRAASATDIAEVISMLLTADCGWLNGADIPVDGGYSAGIETGRIDFSTSPAMQNR